MLYDGECGFCLACARALRNLDRTHRLKLLGFDHPDAESLLAPLAPTERRRALHVVEPDGAMSSAGPALRLALGAAAGRVLNRGPMAWLVDRAYALVAQNRQYLRWIERVDRDDVG